MNPLHKQLFWRLTDPLLRRVGSRLTYLADEERAARHKEIATGGPTAEFVPLASRLTKLTAEQRAARFEAVATFGPTVEFVHSTSLINLGPKRSISIGEHTRIEGELLNSGSGHIYIGHHSYVGPQSRVWSSNRIEIGNHVKISHLVDVHDSDHHALDWEQRRNSLVECVGSPVCIEDDAWICFKSTILKGVTVGRGAIVAAGSVVTADVAPFTLVAGVPARVIRTLDGQRTS